MSKAVFVLPLLSYLVVYFIDGTGFHPSADGYYSWLFARSLAFDGDLDFRNDYALCGDPASLGDLTSTGHPANPFYMGPAIFWTPPLLVLRAAFTLFLGSDAAARASCGGWMTALTLLVGPLCGALTVKLSYHCARFFAAPTIAAFSALLFAFTSPLFPYSTSAAHYSHVYAALLVAALVLASLRIAFFISRPRDVLSIALVMAALVLHRPTALIYAVIPAAAALRGRLSFAPLASVSAGGACGMALTCAFYKYIYGAWWVIPQGPHYIHLGHAHPWLLLFGIHGGFFFWMPAAWLAVAGLWLELDRGGLRGFCAGCLIAAAAEIFISSSPLDWHGNWSLGARRLLPLIPLVMLFASVALERILESEWLPRTKIPLRQAASLVVMLVLVNNVACSTVVRGDRNDSQRDLYGAVSPLRPCWALLDHLGIDLAVLPAEIYFRARYGLPARAYREAITPRYRRNYRDMTFEHAVLDLREPWASEVTSPSASPGDGLEISSEGDARLVFLAEWPFATHLRLLVRAEQDTKLLMFEGGPLDTREELAELEVQGASEARWIELSLPPGRFDSGIHEWIFESPRPAVVQAIAIEDRDGTPPPSASTPIARPW